MILRDVSRLEVIGARLSRVIVDVCAIAIEATDHFKTQRERCKQDIKSVADMSQSHGAGARPAPLPRSAMTTESIYVKHVSVLNLGNT